MRVYAKLHPDHHLTIRLEPIARQCDAEGNEISYNSPYFKREEGWYELPRVPELHDYVEYDSERDELVIRRRPVPDDLEQEMKQATVKRQLAAELPDIILQNKDNPEVLAQALCDRAKEIDKEAKLNEK